MAAMRRGAYGYDAPYALVTGVDIWSTHDQSGNARDVTVRNASLEGVGDRVDIETGDMRALPFPDATFDMTATSGFIRPVPQSKSCG
jgi:arsenite methyltransferase